MAFDASLSIPTANPCGKYLPSSAKTFDGECIPKKLLTPLIIELPRLFTAFHIISPAFVNPCNKPSNNCLPIAPQSV